MFFAGVPGPIIFGIGLVAIWASAKELNAHSNINHNGRRAWAKKGTVRKPRISQR
jgi:hypothetical protein